MAKRRMSPDEAGVVVERNLGLLENLMRHLLVEPQVLNSLPENFELVILPDDDPDIRLYNLELLDQYGSEGRPVVFARLQTSLAEHSAEVRPQFYVPLAA